MHLIPLSEATLFRFSWADVLSSQIKDLRLTGEEGHGAIKTPRKTWIDKFGTLDSEHQGIVGDFPALSASWFEIMLHRLGGEENTEARKAFLQCYCTCVKRRLLWLVPKGYLIDATGKPRRTLPWRFKSAASKRRAMNRAPKQHVREKEAATAEWQSAKEDAGLSDIDIAVLVLSGSIYSPLSKLQRLALRLSVALSHKRRGRRTRKSKPTPTKERGPGIAEEFGEFLIMLTRAVWHAYDGGAFWIWIGNGFKFKATDDPIAESG